MPTGYTADVADGKLTFPQFVWRCARAMGALISMRDCSLTAAVPPQIQGSSYSSERLAETISRQARLDAMSDEEIAVTARKEYEEAMKRHHEVERSRLQTKSNYEKMLADVQAWEPPSSDHQGLKTFMVSQLQESIIFDCSPREQYVPQLLSPEEWRHAEQHSINEDIRYYTKHVTDEAKHYQEVNRWVADLRTSVPQPE